MDVGPAPRRRPGAPAWASELHRWSGSTAFVLTLPVAFHRIGHGFATTSPRSSSTAFSVASFYGAYATKMLCLRLRGLPGWALPAVGGTLLGSLVLLWLTAALWFFTRSGVPLT